MKQIDNIIYKHIWSVRHRASTHARGQVSHHVWMQVNNQIYESMMVQVWIQVGNEVETKFTT